MKELAIREVMNGFGMELKMDDATPSRYYVFKSTEYIEMLEKAAKFLVDVPVKITDK